MDLRPVLYAIGILLCILAIGMVFPMLADLYADQPDWRVFLVCIIITAFFGGSLILSTAGQKFTMNTKQVFVFTSLSWLSLAFFAAFPLYFSELGLSFTDAFFEAMSGITTTGSTVITGLDTAPPGILLWRALLQWLGGIGIILMAMSVLPFLNVGGMQIFRTELSESEKALPRTAQLASSIGMIYVILTGLCAAAYLTAGMGMFDSVTHALTTIATGGFANYNDSFGHYDTPSIEFIAVTFMILGGTPFVLYLKALNGNSRAMFKDSQLRWFLSLVFASIFVMVVYLTIQQDMPLSDSIRKSSFNVVSLITGTGYTNGDYSLWGGFAVSLLFFLMVVGGCAGSTSCGIKIFRFQVLYSVTQVQIKKLIHPNGVFNPHYNNRPMPADVAMSVMSFFFIFALSFSLLAIALSFVGLDFITAMSGSASALANVGPGMGEIIGPTGTFAPLPDSAKWLLCAGMFLGRLELFTVLVMLSRNFWIR